MFFQKFFNAFIFNVFRRTTLSATTSTSWTSTATPTFTPGLKSGRDPTSRVIFGEYLIQS